MHDWNDEPDSLPFADKVQTHTLLRMLQDGLWLDDMRAAASNVCPRHFSSPPQHANMTRAPRSVATSSATITAAHSPVTTATRAAGKPCRTVACEEMKSMEPLQMEMRPYGRGRRAATRHMHV